MTINIKVDDSRTLKVGDIVKYVDDFNDSYCEYAMIIYDRFNASMPYRFLNIESGEILDGFLTLKNMDRHVTRVYEGTHDLIIK